MASREALQKLIQFGNAEQFATHAEDWSACSSAAILNAAVEKLGKLTQQRAYKDNVGTTVQDWNARRTELQESLKLARRRQRGWGAAQARCKGSVFFKRKFLLLVTC